METLFATELCQVLNVISPSKSIANKVSQLKEGIFREFGEFDSYKSKAHITINTYILDSERIDYLNNKLANFFSNYPTMTIEVNGFGFWDSSKTIYLKVEQNESFEKLKEDLNVWRKLNYLKSKYRQTEHSHITIAKNLPSEVYEELKLRYIETAFKESFLADCVLSLSKNRFEGKYSSQFIFPFSN